MDRTISVSGSATVATSPDVADVRLGVSLTRETVGDARTAVAAAMTAVLDALRSTGIEPADIRTAALNLDPHYQYDPAGQQSLIGYQATNVVAVTVREMGRIAAVIDGALGAGATSLDSLSFRIADPGPLQAEARRAAVDDARERAETLAQAAGVEIAGVVSIAEIEPGGCSRTSRSWRASGPPRSPYRPRSKPAAPRSQSQSPWSTRSTTRTEAAQPSCRPSGPLSRSGRRRGD